MPTPVGCLFMRAGPKGLFSNPYYLTIWFEDLLLLLTNFNINSYDVKHIWNNSYIWTAVVDQSEEWSSQ